MANVFDRLPPQAERENIDPQRASEIINEIDNARIRNMSKTRDIGTGRRITTAFGGPSAKTHPVIRGLRRASE